MEVKVRKISFEERRPVSELEERFRRVVFEEFDWPAFFKRVEQTLPAWIDEKYEKNWWFSEFPCSCGGEFFFNVNWVAIPVKYDDHHSDCPFIDNFPVVLIPAITPIRHLPLYFAEFRVPLRYQYLAIRIPLCIVDDGRV